MLILWTEMVLFQPIFISQYITEYIVTKCKIRLAKAPIRIAMPDSWTKSIYKNERGIN